MRIHSTETRLNIPRLAILVILGAIMLLAIAQIVVSYSEVGIANVFGSECITLSSYDLSAVPQSVKDDADKLASELFGTGDKYRIFVNELLSTYVEVENKDVVLLFNPGGWGTSTVEDARGWRTIVDGITSELENSGYASLVLNYQRTGYSLMARLKELTEILNHYPSKARDLAGMVSFLTDNNPELKVIVTGESNGTVFSDYTMEMLRQNQRVYSIQTGTPFWHRPIVQERALWVNDNGVRPDALTQGDIPSMLWATVRSVLGFYEDAPGHVVRYLKAPGHDYSWGYPEVSFKITSFLEEAFKVK